jgi:hypothetical protein
MKLELLKKAVTKFETLEVELEEGVTKTFKLVLDMNAIAFAFDLTGKDFAKLSEWTADSPHVLKLFWASLKRYHPEVTLEEAGSWINPEMYWVIYNMLFGLAFPGFAEQSKKVKENPQGEDQPNP